MTLREIVAAAETNLLASPHPGCARMDAETLLLHSHNQNRAWLIAHWDDQADPTVQCVYNDLVARRQIGEPIQYITGSSEFFGLPFSVGPGVLIPRPETEHLVEEVIRLAAQFGEEVLSIADIGTGSGIIAVALAHALSKAHITAVDLSPQALVVARENAAQNQVADRIVFVEGDLTQPLGEARFHILASNPPYVPTTDHESLAVEVREHEPHSALFAGDDGLAIYQRLIPEARTLLVPGGWLIMEIGYGQQPAIHELLLASQYSEVHFIPDYQGIPRVAAGRRD